MMKRERTQFGGYLVWAGLVLLGLYVGLGVCVVVLDLTLAGQDGTSKFYSTSGSHRGSWVGVVFDWRVQIVLGALALVAVGVLLHWLLHSALLHGRERHALAPRCAGCGYDLRGAEHGRCPECGQTVEPPARPERFERYRAKRRDL